LKIATRNADAADEHVVHAKNTAKLQLRAYVGIVGGHVGPIERHKPIVGEMKSRNAGQTPAYNCRSWYNIDIIRNENRLAPEATRQPPSGASIQLPDSDSMHPLRTLRPILDEDLAALVRDQARIYIYGEIHYTDIFNASHITRFRLRSGIYRGGDVIDLEYCEEGNEAT